mmetsp:Transcript_33885/g.78250  ORF Transcript_33885/g.78250 Transcript_33885/m.78250 type:complete len:276 (-) Transcript_33885:211-1038(-)
MTSYFRVSFAPQPPPPRAVRLLGRRGRMRGQPGLHGSGLRARVSDLSSTRLPPSLSRRPRRPPGVLRSGGTGRDVSTHRRRTLRPLRPRRAQRTLPRQKGGSVDRLLRRLPLRGRMPPPRRPGRRRGLRTLPQRGRRGRFRRLPRLLPLQKNAPATTPGATKRARTTPWFAPFWTGSRRSPPSRSTTTSTSRSSGTRRGSSTDATTTSSGIRWAGPAAPACSRSSFTYRTWRRGGRRRFPTLGWRYDRGGVEHCSGPRWRTGTWRGRKRTQTTRL